MVTDDGSRTLRIGHDGETFHSGCGAVAESLHVYLRNSGAHDRLVAGIPTQVFELGFGTGTALFLTAGLAEMFDAPLVFEAVDLKLLPVDVYAQLQLPQVLLSGRNTFHGVLPVFEDASLQPDALSEAWQQFASIVGSLCEEFVDWLSGLDDQATGPIEVRLGKHTTLRLHLRPFAAAWFEPATPVYDAIYFDPFSPETSPELWSPTVFQLMRSCLKPSGKLTTYCVKGDVRRSLAAAGFELSRVPGPPHGKREVLIAVPSCTPRSPTSPIV
jgi:tRNA U34 5-methylaminomethyl-2-thiouridine-forming methyltransferase MnmC